MTNPKTRNSYSSCVNRIMTYEQLQLQIKLERQGLAWHEINERLNELVKVRNMKISEYSHDAIKFAKYPSNDYPFMALPEEIGEVSGKLAKYMRKNGCSLSTAIYEANNGTSDAAKQLRSDLKKELGDVLWQLNACCNELGLSLESVANLNLNKLEDREFRGVIVGEGDDR